VKFSLIQKIKKNIGKYTNKKLIVSETSLFDSFYKIFKFALDIVYQRKLMYKRNSFKPVKTSENRPI
jgi:hypothetical protein